MSEAAPLSHLAVQLVHDCGTVVGAAQVRAFSTSGAAVTVTAVTLLPRPVEFGGHEYLQCKRCPRPALVGVARERAAAALSDAAVNHPTRGPETREDRGRIGRLSITLR